MFMAMRYGIARGIYANEAGYGTAAVAYGTARSAQPAQQGLNAVIEVFIVSFVTSTISAMTILLTGVWQSGLTSTAAVAAGFNTVMPTFGGWIVAFCAFLFGYTTLIGWAYYGEQFFEYILGRAVTIPYRWIYCLLIPFGAVSKVDLVWAWGDLMNALQVFPEPDRCHRPERYRRGDARKRTREASARAQPEPRSRFRSFRRLIARPTAATIAPASRSGSAPFPWPLRPCPWSRATKIARSRRPSAA